ncbi:hypothetical protein SETIT_7G165600v2 [Setaria italica]|uniref:Late embryogenesis abundant protein LEA-2 subgroup domain-containing protein n=2 Tax=Setaria TaxID=4554 RepID=A0A368RWC0_SETIT|nr:uncharacterized protein LOC111257831 [Setaria italica]RCV34517.1 hypothetical protein SETIT_7G165600v2 [Setaria italica]TKW05422.1 hypothetical protein SEVIR_7G174700v2 [Setaria viridis]
MDKQAGDPDIQKIFIFVLGFAIGVAMTLVPFIEVTWDSPRHDSYSLALTGVDGLVQPASSGGAPSLSPEFNLTLYAENTRLIAEKCFSHGRVAVSYGGVAVGEGRVPGFCAGARSTAEVGAAARGVGVRLPDGQRRRLEAELRWGAAEFDVEAKLFRDRDDETQSPVLLWCKAAWPQLPPQPPRCKAFTDFVIDFGV